MPTIQVPMVFSRDTQPGTSKGAYVYEEVNDDGEQITVNDGAQIGRQYVRKSAYAKGEAPDAEVWVTMHARTAEVEPEEYEPEVEEVAVPTPAPRKAAAPPRVVAKAAPVKAAPKSPTPAPRATRTAAPASRTPARAAPKTATRKRA
jgi:hypothetical protein